MPVTVNGDTAVEANEAFYLRLALPTGATVADGPGLGRITDNDSATFSINDATVAEGDGGTTTATFTVSRAGDIGGPATVTWATAGGTATAGSDYLATGPTVLAFAPGETSRTVMVTVNGDTAPEPNETVRVVLSAPVGAGLATPPAWAASPTTTDNAPGGRRPAIPVARRLPFLVGPGMRALATTGGLAPHPRRRRHLGPLRTPRHHLHYGGLHAGRPPARRPGGGRGQRVLAVEDTGAAYPLTIDPLLT